MDRELDAKFEFNGTTLKAVKGRLCYNQQTIETIKLESI